MITDFKIYELQFNSRFDRFDNIFRNHLNGSLKISDSQMLIDAALHHFDNEIPNDLKYKGTVYRMLQFRTKEDYKQILKKGMIPLENQKYWSCAKYLESLEEVKKNTWYKNFKYYIIFKFDVNYDDVLCDVNKMNKHITEYTNRYFKENEVIVLTKNIKKIPKENIIEHGEIKRK